MLPLSVKKIHVYMKKARAESRYVISRDGITGSRHINDNTMAEQIFPPFDLKRGSSMTGIARLIFTAMMRNRMR